MLHNILIISFIFKIVDSCSDSPSCSILNTRLPHLSSLYKCSLWIGLIAPDQYKFGTPLYMTPLSQLCPFTCSSCSSTFTTTTTPPTTTKKKTLDDKFADIVANDTVFKNLLKRYKIHTNGSDGMRRYFNFVQTKAAVDEHNNDYKQGKTEYQMGFNKFSLATKNEIAPLGLQIIGIPLKKKTKREIRINKRNVENETIDWRSYMQKITDQKNCGGCWAFSTIAMIEGIIAIKNESIVPLSVQQMLDCDRSYDLAYGVSNNGCAGGYFQVAADYLNKKSLTSSQSYPFIGIGAESCRTDITGIIPTITLFDSGYDTSNISEELIQLDMDMEERVRNGPVSVGMAVSQEIYSYANGIYDGNCGNVINHAVVIVGFTKDYWIIRNSWGSDWGENGYMRIRRVPDEDPCMLTQYWTQAIQFGIKESTTGNAVIGLPSSSFNQSIITPDEGWCEDSCCECSDCEDDEDDDDWDSDELLTTTIILPDTTSADISSIITSSQTTPGTSPSTTSRTTLKTSQKVSSSTIQTRFTTAASSTKSPTTAKKITTRQSWFKFDLNGLNIKMK